MHNHTTWGSPKQQLSGIHNIHSTQHTAHSTQHTAHSTHSKHNIIVLYCQNRPWSGDVECRMIESPSQGLRHCHDLERQVLQWMLSSAGEVHVKHQAQPAD